jgi:hypothetical protein
LLSAIVAVLMSCTLISLYYENDSQLQFNGCMERKQGKSENKEWGMGCGVGK